VKDDELDRRLVDATPLRDSEVEGWQLDQAEADLINEITASAPLTEAPDRRSRTRFRRGVSPARFRVAGALLGVAAAGVLTLIGTGSLGGDDSSGPAFAAAAIRVAEANPRLLVTEPGWSVVRADEFEPDSGEMAFSDGDHELTITWYPARYYDTYYRDRTYVDKTPITFELLGQQTRTVQYGENRDDFATMLPPQGETFVEIRGDLPQDEYRALVESLRPTDVETWLAAMPASVVQPVDREAVVDSMLEDMPIPPGLDTEELRSEDAVLDRYQLGARVSGAVACGWLDLWVEATDSGDTAAAQQAVDAMSTSRDWAILEEMESQGGWSQVLWEQADAIAKGTLNTGVAGTMSGPGGKVYEFGPSYASGLGCDSEYKRLREG